MPAGEVLCSEGKTDRELFVIDEGKTDVTSKGKRVATYGDGDVVGEIALLEDTMRTATVTAMTPLRLFVLTRQDFRRLLAREAFEQRVRASAPATFVAWLRRRARLAYSGPLAESSR